jgi:sugar O-acyltransferase (sialic acid O-acetyltransferase NeuD family)
MAAMPGAARRLAIVGSRSLGQQIARHASTWGGLAVAGFLDDFRPPGEATPTGPILGPIDDADGLRRRGAFDVLLVGIGYDHLDARGAVFERLSAAHEFPTLVHPAASADPSARIGRGCVVLPGCLLDLDASLADDVFLNPGCSLSHGASVGAHSMLGPGAVLCGDAAVGTRCFVGARSTVIDGVRLGDGARTGAGAVVVRDAPGPGTWVGVPARKL